MIGAPAWPRRLGKYILCTTITIEDEVDIFAFSTSDV